jgi:hypothetical protein
MVSDGPAQRVFGNPTLLVDLVPTGMNRIRRLFVAGMKLRNGLRKGTSCGSESASLRRRP